MTVFSLEPKRGGGGKELFSPSSVPGFEARLSFVGIKLVKAVFV